MFSSGFTSFSVLFLFPLSIFFLSSSSLCTSVNAFSSNIDEVFLIDPSANVFASRDFNVHLKDWPIYPGGTGGPGKVCSRPTI